MRLAAFSLALVAVVMAGCVGDPPRDNPFDPLADHYQDEGGVTGTVTRFYSPEGIAGARVHLVPLDTTGVAERVVMTGPDGRFEVPDLPTGRYAVVAEAEGFASASDTLVVPLGAPVEAEGLALDGLPVVSEQTVRTANIERWYPVFPLENLIVEAAVSDPDGLGDVDHVVASVPALGFADTLREVAGEPGRYARTFSRGELGHPLSAFLGSTVEIAATDQLGVTGFAPGVQVLRIIDTFPQPLSPLAGATVGSTPRFEWIPLVLPYPFTYRVDVVFVPAPGQQVTMQSFDGLPPSQTEVQLTTPLADGQYLWLLSVLDEFGNRSQMRGQGFMVVSPPLL